MAIKPESTSGFFETVNINSLQDRSLTRDNYLAIARLAPNDLICYESATLPKLLAESEGLPRSFIDQLDFDESAVALVSIKQPKLGKPREIKLAQVNRFQPSISIGVKNFHPRRAEIYRGDLKAVIDPQCDEGRQIYSSEFLANLSSVLIEDLETQHQAWENSLIKTRQDYFTALAGIFGSEVVRNRIVAICNGLDTTDTINPFIVVAPTAEDNRQIGRQVYNHDTGASLSEILLYTSPYLGPKSFEGADDGVRREAHDYFLAEYGPNNIFYDYSGEIITSELISSGNLTNRRYLYHFEFKPLPNDKEGFAVCLKPLERYQVNLYEPHNFRKKNNDPDLTSQLLRKDFARYLAGTKDHHYFGLATPSDKNTLVWAYPGEDRLLEHFCNSF